MREGRLSWTVLGGPRFRRLGPDTYLDAAVAVDGRLRVLAALVHAGEGAVATGWSAVLLHGLDVAPREMPVEVAQFSRHLRSAEVTFRRRRLPPGEVVDLDGGRATTPLRTAFDLATRAGPVDAVVAADALGRLGGFTGGALAAFAELQRGARGVRRVARVAELMDPGAMSPPETRTRLLLVEAGLPRPVTQHPVENEFGWAFAWADLAWPRYRVVVEYDGRDHALADRRGRDLERIEEMRRLGWHVIVVTAHQLRRPDRLVDLVRGALVAGGWAPPA